MKLFLFFLSVFAIYNTLDCLFLDFSYDCDFKFGDPSWNYSKVFFDRQYHMLPGTQNLEVFLKKSPGHMISFVCVNLDGTPKENVIVDFISLFQCVTVNLRNTSPEEVSVNILAMEHGY